MLLTKWIYSLPRLYLAKHIAIAVNNARFYQEARKVAILRERSCRFKDTRDALAQRFTEILSQLEEAERTLEEDISSTQNRLEEASSLAFESLNEARYSDYLVGLPHQGTAHEALSAPELKVLHLMAEGAPNKEIATELFVSESTVKAHITSIFQKLEVNNRTEAVIEAFKKGIIHI
jgi:DNA-binding NarL/FixJ family response regulator